MAVVVNLIMKHLTYTIAPNTFIPTWVTYLQTTGFAASNGVEFAAKFIHS